jgi:hypothetical protein
VARSVERLAEAVGERLELGRVQSDLAGFDRSLHFARELARLAVLIWVEHGREGRDHAVALVELNVDRRQLTLVVEVRIVGNTDPDGHGAPVRKRRMLDHR